jgi:hypothetical protein
VTEISSDPVSHHCISLPNLQIGPKIAALHPSTPHRGSCHTDSVACSQSLISRGSQRRRVTRDRARSGHHLRIRNRHRVRDLQMPHKLANRSNSIAALQNAVLRRKILLAGAAGAARAARLNERRRWNALWENGEGRRESAAALERNGRTYRRTAHHRDRLNYAQRERRRHGRDETRTRAHDLTLLVLRQIIRHAIHIVRVRRVRIARLPIASHIPLPCRRLPSCVRAAARGTKLRTVPLEEAECLRGIGEEATMRHRAHIRGPQVAVRAREVLGGGDVGPLVAATVRVGQTRGVALVGCEALVGLRDEVRDGAVGVEVAYWGGVGRGRWG